MFVECTPMTEPTVTCIVEPARVAGIVYEYAPAGNVLVWVVIVPLENWEPVHAATGRGTLSSPQPGDPVVCAQGDK